MNTRNLTENEITTLKQQHCHSEDWTKIRVAQTFTPTNISHSTLHNVSIGQNCRILSSSIANTIIHNNSTLNHVSQLSASPSTTFANNLPVNVLTEDGARSLPLWRRLSSQLAHLLAHHKHHPATRHLLTLIKRDADTLASSYSHIGQNCLLQHTGPLHNIYLGDNVQLDHTASLTNCYLEGGPAPARLGHGVNAEACVFLSASHTANSVHLEHCLVGEGVHLEHSLYAEHSAFFANSLFKLGEAVSLLAGPFTESHHRSTLVLTCQSSFSTFGSGSNASNHHFKLGPRHGGILRRGTRCGSGSYLYWPCDIGAFSTVVGRHNNHLETTDFPFSLLISTETGTVLVPGVHVFSIGLFRDAIKWRNRDRRGNIPRPLDLVNTNIYSPYAMQAMQRGLATLKRSTSMEGDLRHRGTVIPSQRVQPGIRLYESALLYYTGECLAKYTSEKMRNRAMAAEDVMEILHENTAAAKGYTGGEWRDWGGMLLCGADAEAFLSELENGDHRDWEDVRDRLEEIYRMYGKRELEWACWRWREEYGEVKKEGVEAFFRVWRKAVGFRAECLVKDAGKEFTPELAYGFGVEGAGVDNFRLVRGEVGEEVVVKEVIRERDRLLGLVEKIKE